MNKMDLELNSNEKIEILVELLNEERQERSNLAKKIHEQCSNVVALMRFVEIADRKFEQENLESEHFKGITSIGNTLHDELRELQYSIYPTGSSYTGLVSSLKKIIDSYRNRFKKTEIEYTCIFNEEFETERIKEITIYKICVEIIEFLYFQKAKQISVRLELKSKNLQIEICEMKQRKIVKMNNSLLQISRKIKAKLIWQNAQILPGTNWINHFNISILCPPKEEDQY